MADSTLHATRAEGVGLSIRQPWISLILSGQKSIEVRSWSTKYRGTLWLHAARFLDKDLCHVFGIRSEDVERGVVIGRCQLRQCIEFTSRSWSELRHQHLNAGPIESKKFGWYLSDVQAVRPIPFAGKLGLMKLPSWILQTVELGSPLHRMKGGASGAF